MRFDPHDIVRVCPWSHAVDGPCTNNVAKYQMAGRDPMRGGRQCRNCSKWIAPGGVAATHDKFGDPIPLAVAPLTADERAAQVERCRCPRAGGDSECFCQFIPDAETVAARVAEARGAR